MDGVTDGSGPVGVGGPQRPLPALLQRCQRLRGGRQYRHRRRIRGQCEVRNHVVGFTFT